MTELVDRGVAERPVAGMPDARRLTRIRHPSTRLATGRRKSVRRMARDAPLWYTALLAPVALAVAAVSTFPDAVMVLVLSPVFLGLQALAGMVPARHRFLTPSGWSFLRLTIALLFVWALVNTVGGPARPLFPLYLPVVVAAAALGSRQAAVIGFTKSVAREYASRAVTVNAVAPGFIDTAMTQQLSADVKETLSKQIPLGRLGQPSDVAEAVKFLASDEAGYITGHVLHVNGGMHMA